MFRRVIACELEPRVLLTIFLDKVCVARLAAVEFDITNHSAAGDLLQSHLFLVHCSTIAVQLRINLGRCKRTTGNLALSTSD